MCAQEFRVSPFLIKETFFVHFRRISPENSPFLHFAFLRPLLRINLRIPKATFLQIRYRALPFLKKMTQNEKCQITNANQLCKPLDLKIISNFVQIKLFSCVSFSKRAYCSLPFANLKVVMKDGSKVEHLEVFKRLCLT
jgi:hypothetical protein